MATPSSKLLYDDAPLVVLPQLAALIGTDEALMLQQIHYWLKTAGHEHDGRLWIYNSYVSWTQQLPFWSRSKIGRVLIRLRARGLVLAANYNRLNIDRTVWYSIDYAAVAALLPAATVDRLVPGGSASPPSGMVAARQPNTEPPQPNTEPPQPNTELPQLNTELPQPNTELPSRENARPLPETTTETTAETNTESNPESESAARPRPTVDTLRIDAALTAWLAAECAHVGLPLAALDVERQTRIWRDHRRRAGVRPVDVPADWRMWMQRAIDQARARPLPPEVFHGDSRPVARHGAPGVAEPAPGAASADQQRAAARLFAALQEVPGADRAAG